MTRQNKKISKAFPSSYFLMNHWDHRVTQMTRKSQHLGGSWYMGLARFNIRIKFCNGGEWTTLIISARRHFFPDVVVFPIVTDSADFCWSQKSAGVFTLVFLKFVIAHTFPDFVNSAKPCHVLRNK